MAYRPFRSTEWMKTTTPRRTGFFKANHQFWVFFLGGRGGDHCVSEFFLLFSSNGSHIFCQNIVKSEFRSAFFFSQIHFRNIYFQNFSACQQTQKSCGRLKCVHSVDIGVGLTRRRGNEFERYLFCNSFNVLVCGRKSLSIFGQLEKILKNVFWVSTHLRKYNALSFHKPNGIFHGSVHIVSFFQPGPRRRICVVSIATGLKPLIFLQERLVFGLRLNVLKYFEDSSFKCS